MKPMDHTNGLCGVNQSQECNFFVIWNGADLLGGAWELGSTPDKHKSLCLAALRHIHSTPAKNELVWEVSPAIHDW
jgi:hypothetical protein